MAMRFPSAGCEYNSHSTQASGSASERFWFASLFNADAKALPLCVNVRAYSSARRSRQRENPFSNGIVTKPYNPSTIKNRGKAAISDVLENPNTFTPQFNQREAKNKPTRGVRLPKMIPRGISL